MAWLMLAKLHAESGKADGRANAAESLKRFLETSQSPSDQQMAWEQLARIYQELGEWTAAAQARIRRCKFADTPYLMISNTANWLNGLLHDNYLALDSEEKRVLYRELAELMERKATMAAPAPG
jgi:hypothetical protein